MDINAMIHLDTIFGLCDKNFLKEIFSISKPDTDWEYQWDLDHTNLGFPFLNE